MTESFVVRVAVEAPQHSGIAGPLDYISEQPLAGGTLVRVPLGRREVPGLVWPEAAAGTGVPTSETADPAAMSPQPDLRAV